MLHTTYSSNGEICELEVNVELNTGYGNETPLPMIHSSEYANEQQSMATIVFIAISEKSPRIALFSQPKQGS